MAVVMLLHEGKPAVEIADSHGEAFTYVLEAKPAPIGHRSYVLVRQPEETEEHSYAVSFDGRYWRCNCKAFIYNRERLVKGCKHVIHVRELDAVLRAVVPVCVST